MLEMSKITRVSGLQDRGLQSLGSFAVSFHRVAVDPDCLVVSVHEIVVDCADSLSCCTGSPKEGLVRLFHVPRLW